VAQIMDNWQFLELLLKGGITVTLFVVWYITYTRSEKRNQSNIELQQAQYKELLAAQHAQYKELLDRQNSLHSENLNRLFKSIDDDLKYKEILTGLLARLEIKIDLQERR
jgi:hypothetical protein